MMCGLYSQPGVFGKKLLQLLVCGLDLKIHLLEAQLYSFWGEIFEAQLLE
jgi:hypothetical protein